MLSYTLHTFFTNYYLVMYYAETFTLMTNDVESYSIICYIFHFILQTIQNTFINNTIYIDYFRYIISDFKRHVTDLSFL